MRSPLCSNARTPPWSASAGCSPIPNTANGSSARCAIRSSARSGPKNTPATIPAYLAKGRLGHDKANLLGSLLTTQFQLAAMARTDQPEQDRRDFYLFIDEFQNFSTDAFAAILAEARKYRLCLTLSHQYIDQLPLPIRQAVFGNVGTLVAFRVGHADAEVLENEFGREFSAEQFVELDRYQVLVKLLENGT
jgi:hypothetical protein